MHFDLKQKLLFIILLMLLPMSMMAEVTVQPINGIYYELDSELGTAKVAKNLTGKYSGDIVIPSTVEFEGNTYTVKAVGTLAFYGCTELTRVSLPETIRSIEDGAFTYCSNLTAVDNVVKITRIGEGAFSDCTKLSELPLSEQLDTIGACAFSGTAIRTISLPQKMHWLPDRLFSGCSKLSEVHLPDTVYRIGKSVFQSCSLLQDFPLPKGLTYIGDGAFSGCSSFHSFVLPRAVTYFKPGTLTWGSSLTTLAVEEGNPLFDSRDGCNCIIETASDRMIAGCKTSRIPNSVREIAENTFSGINVVDMAIPEGVDRIDDYAFEKSGITNITLPSTLRYIGWGAFEYSQKLTRVVMDRSSVDTIMNCAFRGCENLRSVVLPETLAYIGFMAFVYCDSLDDVYCFLDFPVDITDYTFTHYGTLHLLPGCTLDFAPAAIWNNFNQVEDLEEWVTGIGTPQCGTVTGQRYDLSGRRMPASQHGVSIIRTTDGKIKKIYNL